MASDRTAHFKTIQFVSAAISVRFFLYFTVFWWAACKFHKRMKVFPLISNFIVYSAWHEIRMCSFHNKRNECRWHSVIPFFRRLIDDVDRRWFFVRSNAWMESGNDRFRQCRKRNEWPFWCYEYEVDQLVLCRRSRPSNEWREKEREREKVRASSMQW